MRNQLNKEGQFTGIYEALWSKVYKFIYYKVQNNEEAEELTQDVFQRVYNQVNKQNLGENIIKAYIFTAARNIIYDLWRKRSRSPKVIRLEDLSEKGFELEDEKRFEEDSFVVQDALKKLSEVDRKIIVLRIIKGYAINEVAKMLDMPEGTVKSRQFRALKKLKDILSEGGYFNE